MICGAFVTDGAYGGAWLRCRGDRWLRCCRGDGVCDWRLVGGSNLAQSAAVDCSGPAMDAAMEIDTERVRRARSVALSYVLGEVFASQL